MWSTTVRRVDGRTLSRWILLAGWPVHTAFLSMAVATAALGLITGQSAVVSAVLLLSVHYLFGLCAGFLLHELGHVVALSFSAGVTAVTLERTSWRLSIAAHGHIVGRDLALAAAAGPLSCVVVGGILLAVAPHLLLHGWFLLHAVFLLPVFNDGRSLVAGLRSWRHPSAFEAPPHTRA